MMIVLVDFAILVIIGEFLRAILITLLRELYICYLNFEILISNNLQKLKNREKI